MENNKSDIQEKMEKEWESSFEALPDSQIQNSWQNIENQISRTKKRKSKFFYYRLSGAAAIFLLMLTSSFYLLIYNPTIRIVNNSPIDKEIILPDGSLVLLKNNSELSYKKRFDEKRRVKLKGVAFFDVVRNNMNVFKVKTNLTTTQVLGTSFTVGESNKNKDTKISLYTGRVLVSVKGKSNSWALIPGESLVYKDGIAKIEKFETELLLKSGQEFLDINNVELERLFEFLEKRFSYSFHENSYTRNKRVTLRINKNDSLEQILKILSIINQTNYEVNKKTKEVRIF